MAEKIKKGDWIRYPDGEGKIIGVIDEGYFVRPKGLRTGSVLVPKGELVEKIAPPEEEEQPGQ
ncbi:hypothetical protein E0L93_13455 [Rubrobacter taiwanensis]|jgi:hypothetical protein|uniref:Uncharacterized protein n=1 Tax=Rubrobacter taiwanensis TaxID=185139 RepID=A0A4R1BDN2_9ACTN|nr:hypothetical protein [Rubrobacter taiwanensis]TCJ15154.1 hypothetical protein E0L93_13455 [Rubrobacter taiwanensis]